MSKLHLFVGCARSEPGTPPGAPRSRLKIGLPRPFFGAMRNAEESPVRCARNRPTLLVLHDDSVDAQEVPLELYEELSGERLPTSCVRDCYRAIDATLRDFRPGDPTEEIMWAGLKAMRDELVAQRPSLVPELLN